MTSSLVGSEMCIRDRDKEDQLEMKQDEEGHHDYSSLTSLFGALMWIACRTRPDLCWAVT
eukprot:8185099-Prorocentrum_lima.AAC.1